MSFIDHHTLVTIAGPETTQKSKSKLQFMILSTNFAIFLLFPIKPKKLSKITALISTFDILLTAPQSRKEESFMSLQLILAPILIIIQNVITKQS